ncbi:MAG: PDZ domain-containing protein [Ginsengibacter sp.]
MKRVIISGLLTGCIALTSFVSFAQKENSDQKKSREIIIRVNGDKDNKMKIEIDADKITVNGKPLSEFHNRDVSIIERDRIDKGSRNFLLTPQDGDMNWELFDEDAKNPTAFLGVITEKATGGAKINEVLKETGAQKGGLHKEDIITKIDDKNISTPEDLMEVVRSHKPNDEIKIYYKRNDKNNNVKVKLGENKQQKRIRIFRNENDFGNDNNYDYNFQMPPMSKIPKTFFKYFRNDNVKLGVKVEDMQNNNGTKILNVAEGSAADKAGLKKDDVITEINGEKVDGVDDLRAELMDAEDKETYTIKVKRNDILMNFDIKIPKSVNSADL